MDVLTGTVLPMNNFGWYFRPSTNNYEFWWQGIVPVLQVGAEVLPAMPTAIADEIMCAVSLKGDRGVLD
jgi:hypothetical protein